MSSITVATIAFSCVLGGALIGMYLRTWMREHHVGSETKELVKLGTGLIATMSALVLGLLVSSSKSAFDTQKNQIGQLSANIVLLDRALAHYGPESKAIRDSLRSTVERLLGAIWAKPGAEEKQSVQPNAASEIIFDQIEQLAPRTDAQRVLQGQAVKIAMDIGQIRWLMFAQKTSAIAPVFLYVVIFWLTITFLSFGLYAPNNGVVHITLFICAVSVASALCLVLELDHPFDGFIQISNEPLRNALALLGK